MRHGSHGTNSGSIAGSVCPSTREITVKISGTGAGLASSPVVAGFRFDSPILTNILPHTGAEQMAIYIPELRHGTSLSLPPQRYLSLFGQGPEPRSILATALQGSSRWVGSSQVPMGANTRSQESEILVLLARHGEDSDW